MSKVLDVPAASSPATDQPTPPSTKERIQGLNSEQRQKYDLTGELPEISSPAPKEETPAAPSEIEGKQKPAPEAGPEKKETEPTGKSERQSRRDARRIGELSSTVHRLQRELDAARAERSGSQPKTEQPQPAKDGRPVRPEEPFFGDFETIDAFKKAQQAYKTKLAEYEDARDTWNRQQWEAQNRSTTEKNETEKRQQALTKGFDDRAAEFEKAQPDFDEKTKSSVGYQNAFKELLETFREVKPHGDLVNAILESDQGPAVAHHLGSHPEELDRILGLSTARAIAEIGKLEVQLARAPKPKTVSNAPNPPGKVGGQDEGSEGPKVGSQAWIDAENAKDVRRMSAGG